MKTDSATGQSRLVLTCEEMHPIPQICRRESKAQFLITRESFNRGVNKEAESSEKSEKFHSRSNTTSYTIDNDSSIVESLLKQYLVSDELIEKHKLNRLYVQLLHKSSLNKPTQEDDGSQFAEIVIDPNLKKKRKKRRMSDTSSQYSHNELILGKIRKLNAINEASLDYDPLVELKDANGANTENESDDGRCSDDLHEPVINNFLHFYRTTKQIFCLSKYIKYKVHKDDL